MRFCRGRAACIFCKGDQWHCVFERYCQIGARIECRGASLDVLKEAYDAYSERIRSPFVGSILFSFVAFNWKPLWFLVFEEASARRKFEFFEGATSVCSLYVWPIVIGIAVALALPWIKFAGAWLASMPTRKLKSHQAEEASRLRIESFKRKTAEEEALRNHEEAVADRTIGAAAKLQEAKDVGGEALVEEVSEAVKASSTTRRITREQELFESLSSGDLFVLGLLGEHGALRLEDTELQMYYDDYTEFVANPSLVRMHEDLESSLVSFYNNDIAKRTEDRRTDGYKYSLTSLGYAVYDLMIADATQ